MVSIAGNVKPQRQIILPEEAFLHVTNSSMSYKHVGAYMPFLTGYNKGAGQPGMLGCPNTCPWLVHGTSNTWAAYGQQIAVLVVRGIAFH